MAHTSNTISAPVTMPADLSAVLGIAGTSLEANCKSSAINPWAKYKPVPYNQIDTITGQWDVTNNKWLSTARWWRDRIKDGVDSGAYCGFIIPTTDTGSLSGGDPSSWTRVYPNGGATQPFRLQDFACYKHDSVVPFGVTLPTIAVWTGSDVRGLVRVSRPTVHEYNLTLNDIINGTAYFGIAVVVGTSVYSRTQSSTSEAAISLEGCPILQGSGITARIIAFMTNSIHSTWTNADYTVWSLDAPNISFSVATTITTVAQASDSYLITMSGLVGTDKSAIRMDSAINSSGTIRANGRVIRVPSHYYYLDSISVNVVRNSDGATVYTGSITTTGAQPDSIELTSSDVGTTLQFACDRGSFSLPTLTDPTDFYIFTYTFNYIQ